MALTNVEGTHELSEFSRQAAEVMEEDRQSDTIEDLADGETRVSHSLPPVDGGRVAWRILLAMFVFEALLWGRTVDEGFPLSFGVFQNYYSRLPQFKDDPYISVIGTSASGIIYMAAPIAIPFIQKFSRWRRKMIWVGWPICLVALVAGSFARSLPTLILTQGVMYALGFTVFYYPMLSMVNEFWIVRRGMAYGLLCAASGVSGAAMPFCIEVMLERLGYQTTLRIMSGALFACTAPLVPLLRGRLPESPASEFERTDWSFLKKPRFWIYSLSNLAMGLGYFFPSLYLPSYASSTGLSSTNGALLLALMSIAQVLGQFFFGWLSDKKLSINLLAAFSTLVTAVAAYAIWDLADSLPLLVTFAIIYGFFGTGFTAMWARMGTAVSSDPSSAFTSFGLLCFGKGIGNVLAGPISGALLRKTVAVEMYGLVRYKPLVLFTGTCMLMSAAVIPLCWLKPLRPR